MKFKFDENQDKPALIRLIVLFMDRMSGNFYKLVTTDVGVNPWVRGALHVNVGPFCLGVFVPLNGAGGSKWP